MFLKCKKTDDSEGFNIEYFSDCNASQNFDSTKLAEELVGSWKWTQFYSELGGKVNADKEVVISFTSAGIFTVTEEGIIVTQGCWALKTNEYRQTYELDIDASSKYLNGNIFLCNNQLMFYSSYIDAGDFLFERIIE
jgi:hypothetical protein